MKKTALTIMGVLVGMYVFAQEAAQPEKETVKKRQVARPEHSPVIYVTTSTGVNNNTAIMGFSFDVAVSKNVSVDAGVGTGTWGDKVYGGVKYYLKPHHRGFAFGTGLTFCPGVLHRQADMKTIYGDVEHVEFNKKPVANLMLAAYKYWSLGRKYNRFYAEVGWSVRLTGGDTFTQTKGNPLSSTSVRNLNANAPGGPILAAGVSFGMH